MKILCDNCGAKYQIADEKVAGRVFKIRCKKCTNIIAVRGDQVAAPAEEQAPAYDYGSDQVWHVVVDGDQQGPFAPSQLGGMLTDGTIDWEAYVWKEGFDGWKPARDVPELVAAITGEPAAGAEEDQTMISDGGAPDAFGAAAADPFGGAAAADPFGGGAATAEADPFGGAAAAPAADPFGGSDPFGGGGGGDAGFGEAARASSDAGADLFAGGGDAGFGGGDDVVASTPSPRVSSDQAMTGQRNENSVLFSLSNLQALATGGSGGSGAAPSASPSGPPAGHATGEGSGLIDIRALASATAATSGSGGSAASSGGGGGVDDLLSIGGGGGGLGPALGAPVLAPAAAEPEKGGKGLIIGAMLGGAVVIGLLVALIVVLMDKPAEQVAAAPTALPGAATAGADPNAPEPAVAAPAAAGVAMDAAEAEATDEGGDEEVEETTDSSGMTTRRRRNPRRGARMTSNAMAPAEMAAPSMSRMSSANSDIDSLLAGALGGSPMMSAAMMAAAMSNLPAQPARDDVASALRRVAGRVGGCGNGTSGTAQARIVFANSGRVRSVNVTGVPPAVQSCVARTVRSARVPAFSRSTFNVNYPFRVR